MALRKNFVFLTDDERTALATALNAVNTSGELATLTELHETNLAKGIRGGAAFLPWHRWFLGELERTLQEHVAGVMLPYWDWTREDSRSLGGAAWKSFFGDRKNTGGEFDAWTLTRAASPGVGAQLPELLPGGQGPSMVDRLASTSFTGFRAIEALIGSGVDNWVGGTMATPRSPADPLYWLHHVNIDRLWAIWQNNHRGEAQYSLTPAAGETVVSEAMVPLNSPMIGKAGAPGATPASMLDHTALGYTYDTDVRLEGAWAGSGRPGQLVSGDRTSVDLFIKDHTGDNGDTPSTDPHWTSPDIWVRNNPPGPTENPEDGPQDPIMSVPNHVYVRVHNRGSSTTEEVTVEAYHCDPALGMLWPTHFTSLGQFTLAGVAKNSSERAGPFPWTPKAVTHQCLLAIVRAESQDPGSLETVLGVTVDRDNAAPLDHSLLVRFDNNVGQRNVYPVFAPPGAQLQLGLLVRGMTTTANHTVVVHATELPPDTAVRAHLANGVLASGTTTLPVVEQNPRFTTLGLDGGAIGQITNVEVKANDSFVLTLGFDFSFKAVDRKRYPVKIEQVHDGAVIGAFTIELTAVKDLDDMFLGNRRSKELHVTTCPLWPRVNKTRIVPFMTVADAVARGYNGCHFCLPDHDAG